MKIIHLCDYIQPNLGYQEYYLAKEHAKMGYDVTVIASDRYYPFPDYKNTVEKVLGSRFIGAGIEKLDGFKIIRLKTIFEFGTKTWLKGLKNEIIKINPDILICHGMDTFNALRIAKLKSKMKFKLIYDDHPFTPFKKIGLIKSIYYLFFNFKLIEKQSDKLIVKSEDGLKHINKYYKFKKPVITGALGVDSNLFKLNYLERLRLRKRYKILPTDVALIYTGKIIRNKGVHLIIDALSKINKKSIILLIIGSGDNKYIKYLRILAKKGHVKVIFINPVKNSILPDFFSMGDIAVWPTEATISVFEAMSCSLPIICNKSTAEFIDNNGFAINSSTQALSTEINFLVSNKKLRIQMGKKSRQLIEQNWSWKKVAEKFI